jgi:hypothetical protein
MNALTLRTGRAPLATALLLSVLAVSPAYADTLTVMWDANPEQVAGYALYMGTQSGSLTQRYDVGNVTSYTISNTVPGQMYCFEVSAYFVPTSEGPRSSQVCGYSNQFPTLANPGNQSSATSQQVALQLAGSDPDGLPVTYTATGLPAGLTLGANTGFIGGAATTAGTFSVTARASDGVLLSAPQTFTWTVTAAPTVDTTPPSVSINSPTSNSSYTALSSTLAVSGTAADSVGVTAVTWTSDRGGSGTAAGTTSWSVPSIALESGTNIITIRARDAAGNQGTDALTVTYSPADTTAPTVSITSPTNQSTFATTSSSVTIGGTSADNVGVTQVTWTNDRGGSGAASGTTSWSLIGIPLQTGANVLTVRARDAAGNQGTDVLTVTHDFGDTSAPTVSILGPTEGSTYTTTSSVVTLGGNAFDNLGITAVTWTNDRGGSGFSSGTTNWSIPSVALQGGTNVITVTAQDAANNRGTDVLTVTYNAPAPADTTAPSISIATPTQQSSYVSATSTAYLAGTSSDNVGVTQVSWVNNRGGGGVASGTSSWNVPVVALQTGDNVITVTARDAAGNQSADVLTVTYAAPAPSTSIVLSGSSYQSGRWQKVLLRWTLVQGRHVDVYRNGSRVTRTNNDGSHTDSPRGTGPFTYLVCVSETNVCSNSVVVD